MEWKDFAGPYKFTPGYDTCVARATFDGGRRYVAALTLEVEVSEGGKYTARAWEPHDSGNSRRGLATVDEAKETAKAMAVEHVNKKLAMLTQAMAELTALT